MIVFVEFAVGVVAVAAIAAFRTSTPSRRDILATRAYVRACYTLERAYQADFSFTRRAVEAVVVHMTKACTDILRDAPLNNVGQSVGMGNELREPAARNLLVVEVEQELQDAVLQSQVGARRQFARVVAPLGWDDRKVTDLIHAVVNSETAWLKNIPPNACRDMKSWVGSGYRRLPASTQRVSFGLQPIPQRISNELVALGYGKRFPERDILQLLKHYHSSSGDITSNLVERLETRTAADVIGLQRKTIAHVEKVLGLPTSQFPNQ